MAPRIGKGVPRILLILHGFGFWGIRTAFHLHIALWKHGTGVWLHGYGLFGETKELGKATLYDDNDENGGLRILRHLNYGVSSVWPLPVHWV